MKKKFQTASRKRIYSKEISEDMDKKNAFEPGGIYFERIIKVPSHIL